MKLGLISQVKEIKEITDYKEVNLLIEKDWILIRIVPNHNSYLFVLGRVNI